jgi:hypothetical protein
MSPIRKASPRPRLASGDMPMASPARRQQVTHHWYTTLR